MHILCPACLASYSSATQGFHAASANHPCKRWSLTLALPSSTGTWVVCLSTPATVFSSHPGRQTDSQPARDHSSSQLSQYKSPGRVQAPLGSAVPTIGWRFMDGHRGGGQRGRFSRAQGRGRMGAYLDPQYIVYMGVSVNRFRRLCPRPGPKLSAALDRRH